MAAQASVPDRWHAGDWGGTPQGKFVEWRIYDRGEWAELWVDGEQVGKAIVLPGGDVGFRADGVVVDGELIRP